MRKILQDHHNNLWMEAIYSRHRLHRVELRTNGASLRWVLPLVKLSKAQLAAIAHLLAKVAAELEAEE